MNHKCICVLIMYFYIHKLDEAEKGRSKHCLLVIIYHLLVDVASAMAGRLSPVACCLSIVAKFD
jgi:hypothetical protein